MVVAIFSAKATNTFFWNIDSTRAIFYDLQHDRIDQILKPPKWDYEEDRIE